MTPYSSPAEAARLVADATGFITSLFLGRGQFAKAETARFEAAIWNADLLLGQHPTCSRRPLIYAIQPDGRSELIDYTDPAILAAVMQQEPRP